MSDHPASPPAEHRSQRFELLQQVEPALERPMTVLAFVWLVLVVVEFTVGLSPFRNTRRALRASRACRELDQSRHAHQRRVMGRRGLSYVLALTVLLNLLGAAGIHAFEREAVNGAIAGYGNALCWTALTLLTTGADYSPLSPDGRVLGLLPANYGFAVFGYVTASIVGFFVARDAEEGDGELAGAAQIGALCDPVATLSWPATPPAGGHGRRPSLPSGREREFVVSERAGRFLPRSKPA